MKNKSARHKEVNTFKFQPFSERLSNIDIDVFHRVDHEYVTQEEEGQCYFFQEVEKWNVLNLTESYDQFKREVNVRRLVTLPQLLLKKDDVVEVLIKHLKLKNPLSLQPLLSLTVALAKDLQKEFYPYYQQFLDVMFELLNTKDTEQLEWTFTALAYLFKFLWRFLVKDIDGVFTSLLPLLSDKKPDYIVNFAAESFSFVARKVKDRRTFLNLILKAVKQKKDGIAGCGRLFFEVVKGVDRQFHSCAESMLSFLFDSLMDPKLPQSVLFEIFEHLISNIVANINHQKSAVFWEVLVSHLENLINSWKDENVADNTSRNTLNLLKLLGQSIEYKQGKFLQNPVPVIQQILQFLSIREIPSDILLTLAQISILLLLSDNINLSQEHASALTRKIMSRPEKSIYLYFVDNAHSFSSFEALILPQFLKYYANNITDVDYFHVLGNLVLKKSPLMKNGLNMSKWSKYTLEFGPRNKDFEAFLTECISITSGFSKDTDNYLCGLLVLPHVNLTHQENVIQTLKDNLMLLFENAAVESHTNLLKKFNFLINWTLECIVHLNGKFAVYDSFDEILNYLLAQVSKDMLAFDTLDLLLTLFRDNEQIIRKEYLEKLNVLEKNLSSPYHEIRLLTTHIFSLFDGLPEFEIKYSTDPDTPNEEFKVFSLCHATEAITPDIQTYREQLQHLGKFVFDKPQMLMCKQTDYKCVPLRYLCGTLFMNFKLLWEPVTKIIESHAHGLDVNEFWSVFYDELQRATNYIRDTKEISIENIDTSCTFLSNLFKEYQSFNVKPDFVNYRILLLKTMALFPDVAESRTRDVSALFLDFVEVEFSKSHSDIALTWNIKENNLNPEIDNTATNESSSRQKSKGSSSIKTLLPFLSIFAKVRSPKSMYKEQELYRLYFDLIQHKNTEIQKAALDCLMTYKHKYMVPYKENLYNLIDDKNFKSELTNFQVNKDTTMVLPEHRDELLPYILKILFSKMNAKTGLRTGGKASGQQRRTLILRFLAGCKDKEMLNFLQLAFKYYDRYLEDDCEQLVDKVSNAVDLENFVPPKRLQSTINLITVVLEQFGGLMENEVLSYLLKVILTVGAMIKGAFVQIDHVHAGYLSVIRTVRTSVLKTVEKYFELFDLYPWSNTQINAIFKVFVWPYLDKLTIEGIHSPTTLLKLIVQWGANPRYFPLLYKHKEGNETQFVLPHVIRLLTNEKSHRSVVETILEMIEKLLTLKPGDDDIVLVIPVDNLLPIKQDILNQVDLNDKLNYGSCILVPFVPEILKLVERKLKSKAKNLNRRELFILSRISELVWEADVSDTILSLLLPIILKRCSLSIDEEVVLQFLTTVINLLNNVEHPEKHIKMISPLFYAISYPSGRKKMVEVLNVVSTKYEALNETIKILTELNAWDSKWIDQPDFQRRHDAFKLCQTKVEQGEVDVELGILLIYNCFFFLKSEKDLSLKENSSYCLKTLGPALIKKYETSNKHVEYIISDTLFSLIRDGMKNKNDDFRREVILVLGNLARECPTSHFMLRDLNLFTNKADPEVDFFENIVHLQIHRHARALQKLCQVLKEQVTTPNTRTITQFLLPLASHYLCNEKFASKNSVVDAAIEAIGTLSRLLPWHQYEALLKFYMAKLRYKLDFQKQVVRIVVVILDSFHYDLNKAQSIANIQNSKEKCDNSKVSEKEIAGENDKQNHEVREGDNGAQLAENSIVDEEHVEEAEIDDVLTNAEDIQEEVDDDQQSGAEIKAYDKITVLCKSTATRVVFTIQHGLLPQLHKSMAELTHHDTSHKVNRRKTGFEREEEDLLRVPISMAVVKLLQRLPPEILDANLPGVFMKLCTFLKSHLESVRRVTRETLQKIMLSLGPKYLNVLLAQMEPLLSRGFQGHVLVFTAHGVLNCLKEQYAAGDIDKILFTILKLCKADLFGQLSEEKEIAKIAVKTSEAKSTKSFDTFQILSQYVTDGFLVDLVLPIKEVLQTSHSFKTVQKCQDVLRHISFGLVDNAFISIDSLLKFAFGTASESIPALIAAKKAAPLTEKEREKLQREKPDCYIIPKAPVGRSGVRQTNVKTSSEINAHLLVEFGLRLCYVMLKREKLKDEIYRPYLDPFVIIFKKCLNSKHLKLSTVTLQCLAWVFKYELPSMVEAIKEIISDMFAILHKYAAAGLTKGDNFDLVVAAFKAMSVLVRDVKYHTIDTEQLKILLLYIEQDMYDHDRQATAFNLLKAILSRKLIVPEIHDVLKKVGELSIMSELTHVRTQARMVFHQYLMDYPLGQALEDHLAFYISQLEYEMQFGRESALEMLQLLINTFPITTLKQHSGTLFVTLGARLINDEVPECRKMAADCITSMISKLPKVEREPLFDVVLVWLKDSNTTHRQLAAQLCGIFIQVEKSLFENRLPKVVPLILDQFGLNNEPGRFVKIKKDAEEGGTEQDERIKDHHYFQVLQLLMKIATNCPSFLKQKDEVNILACHIQTLLNYSHDWVRLAAAQFLGYILASIDVDHLADLLYKNECDESGYLCSDPVNMVKSLALDLCDQLQPGDIKSDFAEQVIKNLVFIARALKKVPIKDNDLKIVNLLWLTKRMRKIVNTEIVETPKKIILRTEVFKWIAGIGTALDVEVIQLILHHLLAPLVREMITTEESNAPLRQLAKEVAGLLKKKIGVEKYTASLQRLEHNLSVKRAERKRTRTQLAVTDPELYAKKKIKHHEKKKEAKKRKIAELKGTKKQFKKRKVVDLEDNSEIM